jgi:hypothetical protein
VVKLVDTTDLKSVAHYERAGSIPARGTIYFLCLMLYNIIFVMELRECLISYGLKNIARA